MLYGEGASLASNQAAAGGVGESETRSSSAISSFSQSPAFSLTSHSSSFTSINLALHPVRLWHPPPSSTIPRRPPLSPNPATPDEAVSARQDVQETRERLAGMKGGRETVSQCFKVALEGFPVRCPPPDPFCLLIATVR
jgi:hypothetical protein